MIALLFLIVAALIAAGWELTRMNDAANRDRAEIDRLRDELHAEGLRVAVLEGRIDALESRLARMSFQTPADAHAEKSVCHVESLDEDITAAISDEELQRLFG